MSRVDELAPTACGVPDDEGVKPRAPALVARKLSLRVGGARAGDVTRPAPSGPSAAGAMLRAGDPYASTPGASRRGLRVHARGTTPPPIAAAPTPTSPAADAAADEPYPWEVSS